MIFFNYRTLYFTYKVYRGCLGEYVYVLEFAVYEKQIKALKKGGHATIIVMYGTLLII